MKITKNQLQKIIKEEVQKVFEIDASGRGAWDPINVKKREKEVHRLGRNKIAQLRRDAEKDQEDRAKSPRFGKKNNKKNNPSKEEEPSPISEDDVGAPIYSRHHGGEDDSDSLDVIFDLAQQMALFTRMIPSDPLRNQLQELIQSIIDKLGGEQGE